MTAFEPGAMAIERGPGLALDQHIDLLRWWRRSPYARSFGENFSRSISSKNPRTDWSGFAHESFADFMAHRLDTAETVFVAADIVENLWGYAANHDRVDVMLPQDFFARDQYIWLEEPLRILDARGTRCTVRVITAFLHENGATLMFYNDRDHEDDDLTQSIRAQGLYDPAIEPRTPLFHLQPVRWGVALAWNIDSWNRQRQYWLDDETEDDLADDAVITSLEHISTMMRFIIALGDFMNDQIPFRRITNRPGLHRWQRAKVNFPAQVRVIDLRVMEQNPIPPASSGEVHWTHRWRSRSHLRRIRDKRTGQIKKIVPVKGSVKGPSHLPLVEKDNVFRVRR